MAILLNLVKKGKQMFAIKSILQRISVCLGEVGSDLACYSELFLTHNITGRRLLMLSQTDLLNLGIKSLGHRVHLMVSITSIRQTF